MRTHLQTTTPTTVATGRAISLQNWVLRSAIVTGVFLRVTRYAQNGSLWLDESFLALNVIRRSFRALTQPLAYNQGAPLGFLFLEKLTTAMLGKGELAFRAVPLIFGLVAIFIFLKTARIALSARAVPLAMALFAVNGSLVYFSSQAKQYSSDACIALALAWLAFSTLAGPLRNGQIAALALGGAAAVWFSHPSIFVLPGIALSLAASAIKQKRRAQLAGVAVILAAWAFSFSLCYVISLRALAANTELLNFWSDYFLPRPLWSLKTIFWLMQGFFEIVNGSAGITPYLGIPLMAAGFGAMFQRDRRIAVILTAPVFFALLASAFRRYPFGSRLAAFMIPALLLLIAEGVNWAAGRWKSRSEPVFWALAVAAVVAPLASAAKELVKPQFQDDIKPVLNYVSSHKEGKDVIYVHYSAQPQFSYYAELNREDLNNVHYLSDCGSSSGCYASAVQPLSNGARVWLLCSHIYLHEGGDERDVMLKQLDRIGVRLDEFKSAGAAAYLYQIGGGPGL